MFTRRPNPFLIGILIGSLFHLMVMPWMSSSSARAQTSSSPIQGSFLSSPETLEIAGFRFLEEESPIAELLFQHVLLGEQLFGQAFPAFCSLITTDRIAAATIQGLNKGEAIYPGNTYRGEFELRDDTIGAELYVLHTESIDIDSLAEEEIHAIEQSMGDVLPRADLAAFSIDDFDLNHIVFAATTADGSAPVAMIHIATDTDNVLLPIAVLPERAAESYAVMGAATIFDLLGMDIEADLVLLGAVDRGIAISGSHFRTEDVYQMSLQSPADRMGMGELLQSIIRSKRCECDCNDDDMITMPPDITSFNGTSDVCAALALVKANYEACMANARAAARQCLFIFGFILATAIAAVCLGVVPALLGQCITTALRFAVKIAAALLAEAIGCAVGTYHCRARCETNRKQEEKRVCTCICSGLSIGDILSTPSCYTPAVPGCDVISIK